MTEWTDPQVLASLALVVATVILAYFTNALKKATDRLGRRTIRPSLALSAQQGLDRQDSKTTLRFTVKSKGAEAAVITGIEAHRTYDDLARLDVIPGTESQPTLAQNDVFTWDILKVGRDEIVKVEIDYEDIEGNKMKPWVFRLKASWLDAKTLPDPSIPPEEAAR